MFIVVDHTITNSDVFFGLVEKAANAPAGLKVMQFLPSMSKDRGICLWDATSVDALKGFLEPLTAQCARNTYYTVDSAKAMGLPTMAAK